MNTHKPPPNSRTGVLVLELMHPRGEPLLTHPCRPSQTTSHGHYPENSVCYSIYFLIANDSNAGLRFREMKKLPKNHTTRRQLSWGSVLDISSPNPNKLCRGTEESGHEAGRWGFEADFERRERMEEGQERHCRYDQSPRDKEVQGKPVFWEWYQRGGLGRVCGRKAGEYCGPDHRQL